ncbi:endonuclease/exonuclease/phosphatase family protein [Hyphomonas sp.]|jgi:endonuclease/exonuclease/phosphatase family metal-dependent hydrolase|uniref:endonuclease/exonuclease/phosphatase family protein n=1 Tax=Hyphomonas sp. TaxID=87 RepID=UPI0032D90027
MPYYYGIKNLSKDMRARTLAGLKRLRRQLDDEMPVTTRNKTLVLGTWNIRNLDDNRFMTGHRTQEDFYYLAEIISRFDVLAIQEICDDITPLKNVMRILGENYDFIITDMTEGRSGNKERLGFIFDKHKVWFRGVAGELVLDDKSLIADGDKARQFSRTPFMCSFQSGWFKFDFSTVHIYFGADSGEKYERRVAEIDAVANFLKTRAKRDASRPNGKSVNHVLVGDFNIKKAGSDGYNALAAHGFQVFDNNLGSNKDQTRFYDQISFLTNPGELRLAKGDRKQGVLQFFKSVYRPADFPLYRKTLIAVVKAKLEKLQDDLVKNKARLERAKTESTKQRAQKDIDAGKASIATWREALNDDALLKKYYSDEWRTFRVSDHLPLWVELEIDFSTEYLDGLK